MPVQPTRYRRALLVAGLALAVFLGVTRASAAATAVDLGTAGSFAVLAGSTVTNTGPSLIGGDLGVSPGSAVTGFPPGLVVNGTIRAADAVAAQAQADANTAYNVAAGMSPDASVPADLVGLTLVSGVYSGPTLQITGRLTLDAQGDPNAVFVFQAASTLITASNSEVMLINGANACNVFWQVGSSATLGTNSDFVGTVMALTSVTANTGATVQGRLLALNGAVTLDTNTIDRGDCAATPPTTTGPGTTLPPTTVPPTTAPPTTAPPTTAPPTTAGPGTTLPPTTAPPTTAPPTTAPPTTAGPGTTIPPTTIPTTTVPTTTITPTTITPTTITPTTAPSTTGPLPTTTTVGEVTTTTTAGRAGTTTSRATTTSSGTGGAVGGSGTGGDVTGGAEAARVLGTNLARTGAATAMLIATGLLAIVLGGTILTVSRRPAAGKPSRRP